MPHRGVATAVRRRPSQGRIENPQGCPGGDSGGEVREMAQIELCPNDNHGRPIVTVRFCPNCGEIVNGEIPIGTCSEEQHAKRRRTQSAYCTDCGRGLFQAR